MKIDNIAFATGYQQNKFNNSKTKTTSYTSNCITRENYNPPAYKPISFSARLFRTPENFYEQPFNRDGMPETMKRYLMEDYSDRCHMPPSQMMALVYDDLNEITTLDQAKRIFPDEPLFQDLKEPSAKARKNIIAGVQLLQDEANPEPLFKNGDNNLGVYILRKIYLEGKTLKEINKDFKNDARAVYSELLPEIDYQTLKFYGIKYPKQSFWHSFYSNRENFPYVYTPRKDFVHNGKIHSVARDTIPHEVKEIRRYNLSQKDLDKMSDSLIKGEGNFVNTKRALKYNRIDKENCNFLFKYMSPIMSVATDRINLSDKLEEFYRTKGYGEITGQDLANLTRKQGAALKEFWNLNPALKEQFSNAIKDTIALFTEEFGADGNNDRFRALLSFAENIKPEREKLKAQNLEKQKYYDEIFTQVDAQKGDLPKELKLLDGDFEIKFNNLKDLDKEISDVVKNKINENVINYKNVIDTNINLTYSPEGFNKHYRNYFFNNKRAANGEKAIASNLDVSNNTELINIIRDIASEYSDKFLKNEMAAKVAMYETFKPVIKDTEDFFYGSIYHSNQIIEDALGGQDIKILTKSRLANIYKTITEDKLTSKDKFELSQKFANNVLEYLADECDRVKLEAGIMSSAEKKQWIKNFKNDLLYKNYLNEFSGHIRFALDKNIDIVVKKFLYQTITMLMSLR